MTKEKFDDDTLRNLASNYYRAGCYDDSVVRILNGSTGELNVQERNILVQFVDKYHVSLMQKARTGMSMKQMRNALLTKADRVDLIPTGNYDYVGNINSAQLRAIYSHVMGIEQLKEEKTD